MLKKHLSTKKIEIRQINILRNFCRRMLILSNIFKQAIFAYLFRVSQKWTTIWIKFCVLIELAFLVCVFLTAFKKNTFTNLLTSCYVICNAGLWAYVGRAQRRVIIFLVSDNLFITDSVNNF